MNEEEKKAAKAVLEKLAETKTGFEAAQWAIAYKTLVDGAIDRRSITEVSKKP